MRPSFRSDLTCSREEQQGVVFYRIDDPQTQTSFRLYEIEFLIAQKLNGQRNIDEVIAAVKDDYNFDITRPDLEKFVSQLESMGFVLHDEDGAGPPAPPPDADEPLEVFDDVEEIEELDDSDLEALEPIEPSLPADDEESGLTEDMFDGVPTSPELSARDFSDDVADVTDQVRVVVPPEAIPDPDEQQEALDESLFEDPGPEGSTAPDLAPAAWPDDEPVDEAELARLLRSAFLHVKQGYIVHARDYFLAAKELDPGDDRLAKLVGHVELMEDNARPEDVRRLWDEASELYPDVAEEVGPLLELDGYGDDDDYYDDDDDAPTENLKARLAWTAVLIIVLAGGIFGLYYLLKTQLFDASAKVKVATLEADKHPVFFPKPATEVGSAREAWVSFKEPGAIESVVKAEGDKVDKGETIAMLMVKPGIKRKLDKMRGDIKKAEKAHGKFSKVLEKIMTERAEVTATRDEAEKELKKLRPESILKRGGVSRRDLEKYKRIVVKANKKLTQLSKKERKPRAQEGKAKRKLEMAQKKLAAAEGKLSGRIIRAPFAGVVMKVKVAKGDKVKPGGEHVLIRDPLVARVSFSLDDAGDLKEGGRAHVVMDNGKPVEGKVDKVKKGDGATVVEVQVNDPSGGSVELEPKRFRMVKEFADPAFEVPTEGVLEVDGKTLVVVAQQGRAARREVEVLRKDATTAIIREKALQDGDRIVVSYPEAGDLSHLQDQAYLEIVE